MRACFSIHFEAVHLAARSGRLRMLKFLLDQDRSLLDLRDAFDYNVLHRAVERGFVDIAKCLLEEYKANLMATVHDVYKNTGKRHVKGRRERERTLGRSCSISLQREKRIAFPNSLFPRC